jgi:hypothetical protein
MTYRYVLPPAHHLTWLSEVLTWRGNAVASLVPQGTATVLRVRHPAYRLDGAGQPVRLTWAEAVPNRAVAPDDQFSDLVDDLDYDNGPSTREACWDIGPVKGALPHELAVTLAGLLPSSDPWWFGVWAGWASVSPYAPKTSHFAAGGRSYHLLSGTAEDVGVSLSPTDWRTPNLWWDESLSWWVHTDVDRADSFLSVPDELVGRLEQGLASYELSAVRRDDLLYPLTHR